MMMHSALGQDALAADVQVVSEVQADDARTRRSAADTYVDDSFEARELVETFTAAAREEDWITAAGIAEKLLEVYGDRLVSVETSGDDPGDAYESIVGRVTREVSQWSSRGRASYASYFAAKVSAIHDALLMDRDVDGLLSLLEKHPQALIAEKIATSVWELSLEAGDFETAERVCLRAGHFDEGRRVDEGPWSPRNGVFAARLAITSALQGDESATRDWLTQYEATGASDDIRWMGRERSPAALVEELLSGVRGVVERGSTASGVEEWPVFGGDTRRARVGGFEYDAVALVWRFDGFERESLDFLSAYTESNTFRSSMESGRHLVLNPVVGDGLVVFSDSNDVWALHANTGRLVWHHRGDDRGGDSRFGSSDQSMASWHSPGIAGGRVFASMGSGGGSYYTYENGGSGSAMICLDARTGRVAWRVTPESLGKEFEKTRFGVSPIATGDSVYVIARRQRTFGFEDCYLLRFRASDGELLFKTHLGSASTGGFGYRRSTLSIFAMSDGVVYVAGNLGTIAAVHARTGRVKWLRMYPRESESQWRATMRSSTQEIAPWHYNPVICTDEMLICKPTDAPMLLVLDRETGEIVRRIKTSRLFHVDTILFAEQTRVYGVGESVFCYDWAADTMIWSQPLPEDTTPYGRGAVAAEHILIPTDRTLVAYRRSDGNAVSQPWEPSSEGGNLIAIADRLLVAGNRHVSSYGRKADVWSRLRREMASRPTDPAPALDLAEIAFRVKAWDDAEAALSDAFRRVMASPGAADSAITARLFENCLDFAQHWPHASDTDQTRTGKARTENARIEQFFDYAGQIAPDPVSHVLFRMANATYLASSGNVGRAVDMLQQILVDRSMREADVAISGDRRNAGDVASERIEALIAAHGRSVYQRHDIVAEQWLQAARSSGEVTLLDRILETHHLSQAAPNAIVLKAELEAERGDPSEAAAVLTTAYMRYGDRLDRAKLIWNIARYYSDAGKPEYAHLWLIRGSQWYPSARIKVAGRSLTMRVARAEFLAKRRVSGTQDRLLARRRPRLQGELGSQFERWFSGESALLTPMLDAGPDADFDTILIYSQGGIRAFAATTGQPLPGWTGPVACHGQPSLIVMTPDRAVLATRFEVFGISMDEGEIVWLHGRRPDAVESATDAEIDPETFARWYGHTYDAGQLVSILDDGRAACVDVNSGEPIWSRVLDWRPTGQPVRSGKWLVYPAQRRSAMGRDVLRQGSMRQGSI